MFFIHFGRQKWFFLTGWNCHSVTVRSSTQPNGTYFIDRNPTYWVNSVFQRCTGYSAYERRGELIVFRINIDSIYAEMWICSAHGPNPCASHTQTLGDSPQTFTDFGRLSQTLRRLSQNHVYFIRRLWKHLCIYESPPEPQTLWSWWRTKPEADLSFFFVASVDN